MRLPGSEGKSQGSGEGRTLLTSVLLSAPGPIVIGLGLLVGRSSTQIADFLRRTAELAAIVCAYVIYRATTADGTCDEERRSRLERGANRFIGAMMCVAGVAMGTVAIAFPAADKGNVIPGLVISVIPGLVPGIFRHRQVDDVDHAQVRHAQVDGPVIGHRNRCLRDFQGGLKIGTERGYLRLQFFQSNFQIFDMVFIHNCVYLYKSK